MEKYSGLLITFLAALGLLFTGSVLAKNSYLNSVNSTCSTAFSGSGIKQADHFEWFGVGSAPSPGVLLVPLLSQ